VGLFCDLGLDFSFYLHYTVSIMTNNIRPSHIEFSTHEYEMNHGARPRGYGSWAFVALEFSRANNYLDHVKWFTGTYGAAKREAARAFAVAGVHSVVVCS
jgi:hemolysin-activating ACP:hemolysin acyltransferase